MGKRLRKKELLSETQRERSALDETLAATITSSDDQAGRYSRRMVGKGRSRPPGRVAADDLVILNIPQ